MQMYKKHLARVSVNQMLYYLEMIYLNIVPVSVNLAIMLICDTRNLRN